MQKHKCNAAIYLFILFSFSIINSFAQTAKNKAITEAANNLQLRGIGPALMGGRIADIAISPTHPSTWYVAAGSGNLWKTINSGITWQAVFDNQASVDMLVGEMESIKVPMEERLGNRWD